MFDLKQIIEIIATVFVSKFCSLLSPDDDSVFYSLGFFIGKQQFVHADGAGLAQESTSCSYNRAQLGSVLCLDTRHFLGPFSRQQLPLGKVTLYYIPIYEDSLLVNANLEGSEFNLFEYVFHLQPNLIISKN